MSFGIEKEELLKNLENLRYNICCYSGNFCDCKYGIKKESKEFGNIPSSHCGEDTGCPEIRQAIDIIKATTEKKFISLCIKANIKVFFK